VRRRAAEGLLCPNQKETRGFGREKGKGATDDVREAIRIMTGETGEAAV